MLNPKEISANTETTMLSSPESANVFLLTLRSTADGIENPKSKNNSLDFTFVIPKKLSFIFVLPKKFKLYIPATKKV